LAAALKPAGNNPASNKPATGSHFDRNARNSLM
jgi:hypothetical protein